MPQASTSDRNCTNHRCACPSGGHGRNREERARDIGLGTATAGCGQETNNPTHAYNAAAAAQQLHERMDKWADFAGTAALATGN